MTLERPRESKAVTAVAVLLLALMAVLAGGAVRRESITFDEVSHIAAGTSYIQKLDMRMNLEHPPLSKVLTGVALALRGARADYSHVSWDFSNRGFFRQYLGQWVFGHYFIATWNDPVSTLWWARVPMLMVTLLLGWVIFIYGKRLAGQAGGLLCLCAYATMPAFLTFGVLVVNDVTVTLFSLLTMWTFAEMWKSPSRGTVLQFGLALGGAILSKFSAGLLFFCFLAFILSLRWRRVEGMPTDRDELRKWRRARWGSLIKGTLVAALVVYLVYLVLSWGQPTDSFSQIPHFPAAPVLRRLLMPPWLFLQGLLTFAFTATRPAFILGHAYPHGEWFYFPILFFLKTPLALIVLLLLSLLVGVVSKMRLVQPVTVGRGMELHWRALWVFLLVLTAGCMVSRITISIRHFLTPLGFLVLLLAPLPRMLDSLRKSGWAGAAPAKWLTSALAVVLVVLAVRTYPDFMPFLNSLSMGKPNYELVSDSNADWNQALPQVEQWAQSRGLQHVLLDEYGFFDPTVYVKQADLWNCQRPGPTDGGQWAVVSAGYILDAHNCQWLLQYPHGALAGGSMYAFQLPPVIPPAGSPGGPPDRSSWRNIGGMPGDLDVGELFVSMVHHPEQLQPTWDQYQEQYQKEMEKRKAAQKKASGK